MKHDSVTNIILQNTDIKNHKRYIDNMFIEREIDRNLKKFVMIIILK